MRNDIGREWGLGLALVCAFGGLAARGGTLTFDDEVALKALTVTGDVTVDRQKNREGATGGALRLGPGGQAIWRFAEAAQSATVDLWVFEDGAAPANPKTSAAGAQWGLLQDNAPALTVGAIYAPYLAGDTTYATADFLPGTDERPWQNVQYLGTKRAPGWHQWTFTLDPDKGLSIACDGKDVNSKNPMFNWNTIRLTGANALLLVGDASGSGQVLWVDDVTATPGPALRTLPLWPPPPPADLAVVPPPAEPRPLPCAAWKNGPSRDAAYFPIAVWLQDPKNAARYKAAGINLYVGLWKGPTEEQLAALKAAEMPVICDQNEVGLKHLDDPLIVAWMHGDEPDNAQPFKDFWKEDVERLKDAWPDIAAFKGLRPGKPYTGYGPPIPPRWIVRDYEVLRAKDPSRPVFLNLSQGVAWEAWHGRGERSGKLDDYLEYAKGCDIVSYDIYPATHSDGAVRGSLWYQAQGIARLRRWTGDNKVVWNCIEGSRIGNPNVKPTPAHLRSEVWISLIHGSRGLIYFVHQFKPHFSEASLLEDPELLAGVTAVNRQVHELAPVLNRPTVSDGVRATSSNPLTPVHAVVKRHDGATWIFAASLYQRDTVATLTLTGVGDATVADVLGEDRRVSVKNGVIEDPFAGYAVHLYRIAGVTAP